MTTQVLGSALLFLSGAFAVGLATGSPAHAITYRVSGIYAYGGSGNCTVGSVNTGNSRCGSLNGYFNWDGTALSGGSLSLGTPGNEPVGGTSPFNFIAINAARDTIFFFNNPSNSPDGLALRFAQALPATTPNDYDSPGLNATPANSFFCTDATASGGLANNSISWGGTCSSGRTSLTDLSGSVKAPAPLSALGLLALAPALVLRRRYRWLQNT